MARRGNHEGNVQWRERENRWRGELVLDAQRKYFYGKTRKDVLAQFDRARKLRDLGLPVGAGEEPLRKFLRRWLEDCVKAAMPRSHVRALDAHIIPALGDIPLDRLTPQEIQQKLIAVKVAEGLAGQTIRHMRAVLRSAFTQAEKWLLVPRNVVKLTDPPRRKRTNLQVFSPEQAKLFVEACQDHRLGPLYCAMLTLGLRMGEALGLKWEDVDVDRAPVFVRRALQRVVKDDGSTELQLVEPKSERSYRVVSIPASIVTLLTRTRDTEPRAPGRRLTMAGNGPHVRQHHRNTARREERPSRVLRAPEGE
jgi:integrase